MDPVGGDGEEPRDPIKLLPEKVWSKIFQLVKEEEPQDILSLSYTCVGFRSILQKAEHLPACGLATAIPLVLKWVSKRDVLNCRGICKTVGNAVDKVLGNADLAYRNWSLTVFARLIPPKRRPPPAPTFEWKHFYEMRFIKNPTISSVERLEALRRDVDEKAVRTVVKKTLDIKFKWAHEDYWGVQKMIPDDFLDKTLALLNTDLISQQVVHLRLESQSMMDCDDPIVAYDVIRRCVGALQNLKSLRFFDFFRGGYGEGLDVRLDRYIAQGHLLPPASHLEELILSFAPLTLELRREVILRYGSRLKRLAVNFWMSSGIAPLEDYHFPELRSLVLSYPEWDWDWDAR